MVGDYRIVSDIVEPCLWLNAKNMLAAADTFLRNNANLLTED